MKRTWTIAALASLTWLGSAAPAQAFGWSMSRPVDVYYMDPCWGVPVSPRYAVPAGYAPGRLPNGYSRDYAPATAAPASPEPIQVMPRRPEVTESRSNAFPVGTAPPATATSYYDAYYVAAGAMPPMSLPDAEELCGVAFWNLSENPISLTVSGRAYQLERGKRLRVNLPRRFVWKVGNRDPESIQVAEDRHSLEIVIRK